MQEPCQEQEMYQRDNSQKDRENKRERGRRELVCVCVRNWRLDVRVERRFDTPEYASGHMREETEPTRRYEQCRSIAA